MTQVNKIETNWVLVNSIVASSSLLLVAIAAIGYEFPELPGLPAGRVALAVGSAAAAVETAIIVRSIFKFKKSLKIRASNPPKIKMDPLLHEAAIKGDEKAIIRASNPPKIKMDPLLHEAAAKGDEKAIKRLLNSGAEIECKTCDGKTPLYFARYHMHEKACKLLIERGASQEGILNRVIKEAIAADHVKLLQDLIDNGLKVNSFIIPEHKVTLLHLAATQGKLNIVRLLLKSGADPEIESWGCWRVIHYAAIHGHKEVVEALKEAGADPTPKNSAGQTPDDLAKLSASEANK